MGGTVTKTLVYLLILPACVTTSGPDDFERVKYNNPGLVVNLGVGLWAWPLPMDYDNDGDYDMLVSCPDKPYNGIYFFENTDGNIKMPVFKPAVKLDAGYSNIRPSYIDDRVHLLLPGREIEDFREPDNQFKKTRPIYSSTNVHDSQGRVTLVNGIDQDTYSVQVIDLGKVLSVPLHLLVDAPEVLDSPVNGGLDTLCC